MESFTTFITFAPLPRTAASWITRGKHSCLPLSSRCGLPVRHLRPQHPHVPAAQVSPNASPGGQAGDDADDVFNVSLPPMSSTDSSGEPIPAGPGPDADEMTVVAYNSALFPKHVGVVQAALRDTVRVEVALPLSMVVEELESGDLFIDEILPDGNAAAAGLLREGDVLVAASLPIGDVLAPLQREDALDEFASMLDCRDTATITLVVRRGDVHELRARLEKEQNKDYLAGGILDRLDEIHVPWYPIVAPDEIEDDDSAENGEPKLDLDAVREAGMDMDRDVSYTPTDEELANTPTEDGDNSYWQQVYDRSSVLRRGPPPNDGNGSGNGSGNIFGTDLW